MANPTPQPQRSKTEIISELSSILAGAGWGTYAPMIANEATLDVALKGRPQLYSVDDAIQMFADMMMVDLRSVFNEHTIDQLFVVIQEYQRAVAFA